MIIKYLILQQLSVGICLNRDNHNEVIEAYNLVFKYKDDECSVTCNNKTKTFSPKLSDPTVKATMLMLKNITAVSNILEKLPQNAYLTMKLLYYDDVTPVDYEPPGFEASSEPKFSFAEKTMNISLGKVDTNDHGYKFLLKTTFNKQSLSQNDEDPLKSLPTDKRNSYVNSNEGTMTHESRQHEKENLYEKSKKSASINCPCKCKLAQDHDVIACAKCEQLQHKTCYGLLNPQEDPFMFYCVNCTNDEDYSLIDLIYTYTGKECQEFCLTRRVISLCLNQHYFTKLNLEKLLGCSKTMANAVIKKLAAQDFIELRGNTDQYQLTESNKNIAMLKYFPSTDNKENEGLMDEDSKLETNSLPSASDFSHDHQISSLLADDSAVIESSLRKVRSLNLHDKPPASSYMTRKRKASCETVSLNDSADLFQSQKRIRTRTTTKRNLF